MIGFVRHKHHVFSFICVGIFTGALTLPFCNSQAATKKAATGKASICGRSEALNAFLALSKDSQENARELSSKLRKEFKSTKDVTKDVAGDLSKTTVTDTLNAMHFDDVSAFPTNLEEALVFRGNQLVRDENKKITDEPNVLASEKNKSLGSTRELALSELQRRLSLLFAKGRTNIIALGRSSSSPKITAESEKALLQFSQAEAKIWGTFIELSTKACAAQNDSKPYETGGAR